MIRDILQGCGHTVASSNRTVDLLSLELADTPIMPLFRSHKRQIEHSPRKAITLNGRWLSHPIYLDVEMIMSFLAAVEDGVSYSSEIAERYAVASERENELSGKAGLPSITSALGLTLSAEGRHRRKKNDEESAESKFTREHTSASLFNRLRKRLHDVGDVMDLGETGVGDAPFQPGALVELRGEIIGNPLRHALEALSKIMRFMGIDLDAESDGTSVSPFRIEDLGKPNAPSPDMTPERMLGMMRVLKQEVESSPVQDLVMRTSDNKNVVVTVSREYLTADAEQNFTGASIRILAKVSNVIPAGKQIRLLRRSTVGSMSSETSNAFLEGLRQMSQMETMVGVVDGPTVQLLPLAIFV